MLSSVLLAFQFRCSQVCVPVCVLFALQECSMIVPFLAIAVSITFHSDSLPYLLFCFPLQHCVLLLCYCSLNVSCVN